MKIFRIVDAVVDQQRNLRIERNVGKLAGGPWGDEEEVAVVMRNRKAHQAGIGTVLTGGGKYAKLLLPQQFVNSLPGQFITIHG